MIEPVFPDGIRVFAPHENAPEFVKGQVLIDSLKFSAWLGQQPDGQVRLDIKLSKKGSWYLQLNTWKPDTGKPKGGGGNLQRAPVKDEFEDSEIPFITNGDIW